MAITKFNPFNFARQQWVQAGHMRTDDLNQQRKRTHDEISNNDDDDETTGKIFMTSDLF